MRTTREILRLRWGQGRSLRAVAQSCGIGATTVHDVPAWATATGLTWPLSADLDDAGLEARLYPPPPGHAGARGARFRGPLSRAQAARCHLGAALAAYRQAHPAAGYGYPRFCVSVR
jgi:hypothetical protein